MSMFRNLDAHTAAVQELAIGRSLFDPTDMVYFAGAAGIAQRWFFMQKDENQASAMLERIQVAAGAMYVDALSGPIRLSTEYKTCVDEMASLFFTIESLEMAEELIEEMFEDGYDE